MLNMIKGCRINDPSLLHEGYERIRSGFVANVNAENIQPLLEYFVALHNEQCFFFLEVPTNARVETTLSPDGVPSLHMDVYYLDNMTPEQAVEILHVFGEWFVHDGLSKFGIGIHSGANEIVIGKFNIVSIYTRTPQRYSGFFETRGIHEVTDLKTAWDYFTDNTPGDSYLYRHQGKTIYDMVEYLKQYGLYFAERR